MPIPAKCDRCGARFQVPEVHAGKRGRCQRCGHVFEIPEIAIPGPVAPETATHEVPTPKPSPAVKRILDEEYALGTAAPGGAAPVDASLPRAPRPGAPKRADMTAHRPLAVALAILLYFLTIIPLVILGAIGVPPEALVLLWLMGFPVVIIVGILKCQVRYEASISPTGKPILAVEKHFFGWRHSCEILNLNDYRSMRRIDYDAEDSEANQATGCLVFSLFGLPGLLVYSLANSAGRERARYEVLFIARSAAASDFTVEFPKPRQAAELAKIVANVTGLPLDRMTQFGGV